MLGGRVFQQTVDIHIGANCDTVGIRIHKVDRTNTDSNILPCKVLEVKKVTDSKSVYKIFSKDGILKTYYSDEDLVDLRTVCFPGLNYIDPNLLLKISDS